MKMNWFIYSILAMFCIGGMILLIKYLITLGLEEKISLFYIFTFAAVLFFIFLLLTKTSFKVTTPLLLILIGASLLSFFGNLFYFKAIGTAPNPGYAVAVTQMQIIFITIFSTFLFKSELHFVKFIGIIFAVIGIILIAL